MVIGPYALVDVRANLNQPVIDLKLLHDHRESSQLEKAVALDNQNTRELVVLTVLDLYFQAVTGKSRMTAVEAQVARAQALYQRAADLKGSGVAPGIDVVRAQVELQTQQQRQIQATNEFAMQKLNLARAIGLPLGQEFTLANELPSTPSAQVPI